MITPMVTKSSKKKGVYIKGQLLEKMGGLAFWWFGILRLPLNHQAAKLSHTTLTWIFPPRGAVPPTMKIFLSLENDPYAPED